MKNFIIRSVAKLLIAITFCFIFSMVLTSFAPHLTNDIAIDQLKNEDLNWTAMNIWNQIQNYAYIVYGSIIVICGFSIGKDIYKIYKLKREVNN